jgi:hypothetical protein
MKLYNNVEGGHIDIKYFYLFKKHLIAPAPN